MWLIWFGGSGCDCLLMQAASLFDGLSFDGFPSFEYVCRQNISDIWFGDKRVCGSSGLEVQAAIAC